MELSKSVYTTRFEVKVSSKESEAETIPNGPYVERKAKECNVYVAENTTFSDLKTVIQGYLLDRRVEQKEALKGRVEVVTSTTKVIGAKFKGGAVADDDVVVDGAYDISFAQSNYLGGGCCCTIA